MHIYIFEHSMATEIMHATRAGAAEILSHVPLAEDALTTTFIAEGIAVTGSIGASIIGFLPFLFIGITLLTSAYFLT